MNDLTKRIILSKRDFKTKAKNYSSSTGEFISKKSKSYSFRDEFRIIEQVRKDGHYYVTIEPILKKRKKSNKEDQLYYNLSSLKSHFYFKTI